MQTIYLSGPIADCTNDECVTWRERVKTELGLVYKYLDPMVRDYRNVDTAGKEAEIVEADIKDINACDILLAYVPKISTGTIMEIFYAFNENKHVVVVCPLPAPSPWLKYHTRKFFTNLEDAIKYLKND